MNVFFYWSGQGFDFSHLLSIASAALHAPGNVVVLVDERPVNNPCFDRLAGVPDTHIAPLVLTDLLSAPLVDLYRRMQFAAHRSDLVRFAVLARYGGLYLDTDTVTRRSLSTVGDRLLFFDGELVHNGMMSFAAPGDPLPLRMMANFLTMPESALASYPSIIHRWTQIVRQDESVRYGDIRAFAPVHWTMWESIFAPGGFDGDIGSIHVLHHYGHFSCKYTSSMDVNWLKANPCLFSQVALPVISDLRRRLGIDLRDHPAR